MGPTCAYSQPQQNRELRVGTLMFDACKTEFYLKIKHSGAAVPAWRAEAVR